MPNFAFFLIACAAIIAAFEIKKFRRTRHVLIFTACGLVLLGATDSVMMVEPNHVRVLAVSDKPYRIVDGFHLMVAGRPYEEMNISGEEITRRVSASAYGNTPDSKIRTEYKISASIAYRLDIENENIRRYMDREDKAFRMYEIASKEPDKIPEEAIWQNWTSKMASGALIYCLSHHPQIPSHPEGLSKREEWKLSRCVKARLNSWDPLAVFSNVNRIEIQKTEAADADGQSAPF